MNEAQVRSLILTAVTGISVYPDFVPEDADLPAISFSHIINSSSRLLQGNSTGEWNTWRILVVGNTRTEVKDMLLQLEMLDNTLNSDFQRVFVVARQLSPALPDDATRGGFIDIKAYDR